MPAPKSATLAPSQVEGVDADPGHVTSATHTLVHTENDARPATRLDEVIKHLTARLVTSEENMSVFPSSHYLTALAHSIGTTTAITVTL